MLQLRHTDNRCYEVEQKPDPASVPDVQPKGRVCSQTDCDTILSIYNPNKSCWQCIRVIDRDIDQHEARLQDIWRRRGLLVT